MYKATISSLYANNVYMYVGEMYIGPRIWPQNQWYDMNVLLVLPIPVSITPGIITLTGVESPKHGIS